MDLKFPRKSLLERSGLSSSSRKLAFLAVAGLIVVVGIGWRASNYFGGSAEEETAPTAVEAPKPAPTTPPTAETDVPQTPAAAQEPATPPATQDTATAPNAPAEPAGDAVEQADLPEGVDPSMILVSKRPVEVLSSPSSTAPSMFGFPAGRPFRVIGREGGFVRIKDLRSGASGWIEEAALAPAKRAEPVAAPSPSTGGGGPKPAATSKPPKKDTQVTSESAGDVDSVETRKRPGLFGKGGLFGGLFGN